jgi:hypothetical protein
VSRAILCGIRRSLGRLSKSLAKCTRAPPTFVKPVHVQLSNKGRNVGVLEIRPAGALSIARPDTSQGGTGTYDRTFENSLEGDMTKLSLVLDQEIRCWML